MHRQYPKSIQKVSKKAITLVKMMLKHLSGKTKLLHSVMVDTSYSYVYFLFCFVLLSFADFGSQDCYDIPRSFPSDKSCSFDFNENFNTYLVSDTLRDTGLY